MTQETRQILEKTFEQMSNEFTSHEFSRRARMNGITNERFYAQGCAANYLHTKALQTVSNRSWVKKQTANVHNAENTNERKIFDAIALLKAHGYKIMQKETKYVEI